MLEPIKEWAKNELKLFKKCFFLQSAFKNYIFNIYVQREFDIE